MRMASCNSPRPCTLKASGPPASSTRMETLVSSSLSRRSRRLRDVTYCPSLPENGDVLMVNVIAIVGSLQSFEGIQLGDARVLKSTVQLRDRHIIAIFEHACEYAPDRQAS